MIIKGCSTGAVVDYHMRVARGEVPGESWFSIGAHTPLIQEGVEENVWDYGGLRTQLTAQEPHYITSSSPLDIDVQVLVKGVDSLNDEITSTVTTDGGTQVLLDKEFKCVNEALVLSGHPTGDLFIGTVSTLTGGIPDDASSVQSKITFDNYITHNGWYLVPNGCRLDGWVVNYIAPKGKDVTFHPIAASANGIPYRVAQFPIYQAAAPFGIPGAVFKAGQLIETRVASATSKSSATFFWDFICTKTPIINP